VPPFEVIHKTKEANDKAIAEHNNIKQMRTSLNNSQREEGNRCYAGRLG
jgi:hypothetical protein